MPADRGGHRLVAVDLQPERSGDPGRGRSAGRPSRRRASPDPDRSRSCPRRPAARVGRGPSRGSRAGQARAQRVRRAREGERGVADAAGERGHRERSPRDRAIAPVLMSSRPSTANEARRPPATRSTTARTPGAVSSSRSGSCVGVGQTDGQRATAGGRPGAEWGALGDQLVDRRRGPEDLLVEADDDPADALPDRLALLLRHPGQSTGAPGVNRPTGGREPPRFGRVHVAEP